MNTQYNTYIDFLIKYREVLATFLDSENEKRRALLDNDLERLEAMLKLQQAEIMKFRGLETRRAQLQTELGLPDLPAKELLADIADEEARGRIAKLTAEMAELAAQIREQNHQSLELAQANLRVLEMLRRIGDTDTPGTYYRPEDSARKGPAAGSAFQETV